MIKWKNRDLKELGIIVEKTPEISKGKKKINIYEIPGRNGFLSVDTGVYEPFSLTLECHCLDTANKDEIKKLLDGFGTLTFDNQRQYYAVINDAIPFEKVLRFKRFQINFLVNPVAEDIDITTASITNNPQTLNIQNSYSNIEPILKITCTGNVSITINNKTFTLSDTNGSYILDCKNKIIVDSNGNNKSSLMKYDFPTLVNGNNSIEYTGTITNFTIEYRKTYL